MRIKAIRGVKDILPAEAGIWRFIEERAGHLCEIYGYQRMCTPILEETQLFVRSIGRSCDIVRKEMFSFSHRQKRNLCLRPEATASVVRAYLEHNLDKAFELAKFYYLGPMFRAERPQAGRLRQFHHIGAEAIGSPSAYIDAEIISLAVRILQDLGVENFILQLNSIGCLMDRQRYKERLTEALRGRLKELCADCRSRYQINFLRIFDCKNPHCRSITHKLPRITAVLCPECREHFLRVEQILTSINITYELNPYLVRGLDYYTRTCFELIHPHLGAQNAVGAGGRYDNLVRELGGPQRAACGFALGVERIIATLPAREREEAKRACPHIFIAAVGEEAREAAFKLLESLRKEGTSGEMDYLEKSLKGQMRLAHKLGVKYVAILGEAELKKQVIILRDMHKQSQQEIKIDRLREAIK